MRLPAGSSQPKPSKDQYFKQDEQYLCPNLIAKILRTLKKFIRKIVENPLIAMIILGFLVFVFGFFGFYDYYYNHPEDNKGIYDIVYLTLQLFVLQSGSEIPQPPLLLNIGRFLAAIFFALAFVSLIVDIFWQQIQSLRLFFSTKPKAIICGFGYLGPLYVREFERRGYRTVIIEKNPDQITAELPESKVIFIKGDATNPEVLRHVHIRPSDIMVIVTGDDLTNIRIVMTARELVKRTSSDTNLTQNSGSAALAKNPVFLVHILDRWLDNALRIRFYPLYKDKTTQFFPFNMYTRAAKKLTPCIWEKIATTKPDDKKTGGVHLLLIGVGTMGEEICKQFIEHWNREIKELPDPKPRLTLTLIDYKESADKAQRLHQWIEEKGCPARTVVVRPFPFKIPSANFMEGKYLWEDPEWFPVPPVSAVIICLANPTLAMTTALEIVPIIRKSQEKISGTALQSPPIFVRFIRKDEITRFINMVKKQEPFSAFKPYTVAESGAFWDEELEIKFPEKPCKFMRFCPFKCKKKTEREK